METGRLHDHFSGLAFKFLKTASRPGVSEVSVASMCQVHVTTVSLPETKSD